MMYAVYLIITILLLSRLTTARRHASHNHLLSNQYPIQDSTEHSFDDQLPFSTRAHWMRVASLANYALSPCPFGAYGTAVVNSTLSFSDAANLGELICTGLNDNKQTGNPIMHGEIAAFQNCTAILTDPKGYYKLSAAEANEAWKGFSLYTNAEPCSMCSSAIVQAGLREVIYGTSIERLIEMGWPQIEIRAWEVLEKAWRVGAKTRLVEHVLANETDGWFGWQFGGGKCPEGCARGGDGEGCEAVEEKDVI